MFDLRLVTRGALWIFSAVDYPNYGFIEMLEIFVPV